MFIRAIEDFEKLVSRKGSRKKKTENQRDEKALGVMRVQTHTIDRIQ
jgi:hypothetical protein